MGPPRSFPNFEDETLIEGGNPWQHKQERKLRGQPTVLGFGSSYLCKKPYFTDFCFDDRWNIHISTGSCLRVKSPHVSLTTTHLPTCCAFRKKLLNISLDPSKGSWRTVKKKKQVTTGRQTSTMSKKDKTVGWSLNNANRSYWSFSFFFAVWISRYLSDQINSTQTIPRTWWRNVSNLFVIAAGCFS